VQVLVCGADRRQPEARDTAGELSFEPFRLLPQQRLLTRDGEPVRLGGQAMEILIALAQRPGRTVRHWELMRLAWAGLAVGGNTLRVHMIALRKAHSAGLGDCGGGCRMRHGRRRLRLD
jgi:DNA-binding winged helix-turn-helix (wHTH) protein